MGRAAMAEAQAARALAIRSREFGSSNVLVVSSSMQAPTGNTASGRSLCLGSGKSHLSCQFGDRNGIFNDSGRTNAFHGRLRLLCCCNRRGWCAGCVEARRTEFAGQCLPMERRQHYNDAVQCANRLDTRVRKRHANASCHGSGGSLAPGSGTWRFCAVSRSHSCPCRCALPVAFACP